MKGARYRLWQFWRLVVRRIAPHELAQVQSWLPAPLFALFCHMTPAEQYHAYCVRQMLVDRSCTDGDLLTAALLHDVGKSAMPLAVWEKVAVVLGGRFAAQTVHRWGSRQGPVRWWTRPFVNMLQHPAWGAEMVAASGGSPLTIELIRRHADKVNSTDPLYPLLSALQSADNSN